MKCKAGCFCCLKRFVWDQLFTPFFILVFLVVSENIAHLAESALRFLELVQENNVNTEQDLSGEDTEETLHPNENYDSGTETHVS